jgi:endogenous inhibitor of DNA gyrase (YacG/DUF329 family)
MGGEQVKPPPIAKCSECGREFVRRNTMHRVCSPRCAAKTVKAQRRKEKAALKARKEAAKPRSQWLREAQTAFNAYIRARDSDLPCISCGRHHDGQWHAGHYLSTGARPELRFDEANVWRQCQPCNTHLHGNLVLYRTELIRRIGLAEVERLEGPHQPKKYTVAELREIKDTYRAKLGAFECK